MKMSRIPTRANAVTAVLIVTIAISLNNYQPLFADPFLPQHIWASTGEQAGVGTWPEESRPPLNQSLAPAAELAGAPGRSPMTFTGPENANAGGPALPLVSAQVVLLEDDFNRANNPVVGESWVEVEQVGATVSIGSNQLLFDDASDAVNRPLVRRSFTGVDTGTVLWEYDFDFTRTGPEGTYRFLMQLGDSGVMTDGSQNGGVGVNLIWTTIGGVVQSLGHRNGTVNTSLGVVSGPTQISVEADLDAQTYTVSVNGGVVGTGIAFDAPVTTLDQVRYMTDNLNEVNFAGRTIDNVIISSGSVGPGDVTAPVVTIVTPAEGASFTLNQVVLADFSCVDEAGGSGIASCVGDVATGTAIDTGTLGAKSFTVTGTDVAGNTTVVTHNYTVISVGPTVLLEDTFTRPDSSLVGNGWVEVEAAGATVSIASEELFVDASSNGFFRPLVSKGFTMVNSGTLLWEFDFDWTRTAADTGYEVWMQLGDSSFLQVPSTPGTQFTGVGVNLRWGSFNLDQQLVARQNGGTGGGGSVTPLGVISGPTHLTVTVNMDAVPPTYSVDIDGAPVASGLFFDDSTNVAKLDTVRFVTNNLIGTNFSGRTFDNVIISAE